MSIEDAKAINKQQPANQREFAGVVVGDNRDTPASIPKGRCIHLNQMVIIEMLRQDGVAPDFLLTEGGRVGRVHTFHMVPDIGDQR